MPALKEPPATTEIASGSFADAAGGEDDQQHEETHVETGADDAARAAEEKAAADAAAAAASTTTTKKGDNPNLEENEEKPVVVADDEIPADYTKGMTTAAATKAKETWKTLKTERQAAITERDAFKAQIADFNKRLDEAGKAGPEVERLKKEIADRDAKLKEYEGEISVTRIEATPQYKTEAAKIRGAEDFVRGLAKKHDMSSAAALLDALRETDPEKRRTDLEELSSDFGFVDRTEFISAAKAHAEATAAAEALRKDAGTKLEQITREQQMEIDRTATANLTDFRTSAEEQWKAMQEAHPILRHVEGKPEWNAYLDSIGADITGVDVNNLPIIDVAKGIVADRVLPEITKAMIHYQGAFKKEREARLASDKKLADYRATAPGAGGGRTTEGGAGKKDGDESFLGAVAGDE